MRLEEAFDLPEQLPADEQVHWIGRPDWKSLARCVFHIRAIALYFIALALWRASDGYAAGGAAEAMFAATTLLPAALAAIGILAFLAWLTARSTVYGITSKRLMMKVGVAVPITLNLPFAQIESAALRSYRDGSGDIPILPRGGVRLGYAILWPHARPWHVRRPQPMLRAVPDADQVARLLGRVIAESDPDVQRVPDVSPDGAESAATSAEAGAFATAVNRV